MEKNNIQMDITAQEVAESYEGYRMRKHAMGMYYNLCEKHEQLRKREAAAEAERTQKRGKRNRLSQWWYNLRRHRQEEDWFDEEQELLEVANPLMAMARFKEHEKK